jgi:hypothetical protein
VPKDIKLVNVAVFQRVYVGRGPIKRRKEELVGRFKRYLTKDLADILLSEFPIDQGFIVSFFPSDDGHAPNNL